MRAPTQRELGALSAIAAHAAQYGFPPTQLELSRMLGVSRTRAAQLLAALDWRVLIEITGTAVTARGIRITDAGSLALLDWLAATVTTSTSCSARVDIPRAIEVL
jgi:DNA-binding Lrp family transcriptional regulator